jgi:hypothetical protein
MSLQRRTLAKEEVDRYNDAGWVLLRRLIAPEYAAALRNEVLEIMRTIGLGSAKLRQTNQYLAGSGLDRLINSEDLRGVASQLMDGPARIYLPFTAVKSSGGGRFHFHQDNQYTRFDGPGLNTWFALEWMDLANGCLQVVSGSHRAGTLGAVASGDGDSHRKIAWEPEDFLPVTMEPGDCVAFSRLTIHGSGVNTASEPRVAYAIQFHREDVNALIGGEWKRLAEHPRWHVGPVPRISALQSDEMLEGH